MHALGRLCERQYHMGRMYAALTARIASQGLPSDAHTLQHTEVTATSLSQQSVFLRPPRSNTNYSTRSLCK